MTRPAKPLKVRICRLSHADGLPLPVYQTVDAAGMDLVAANPASEPVIIASGARATVPTGLTFELPPGMEAQVRPRSGLAAKYGVTVLNSPGTIDADYRGEISVILINHGDAPFTIRRGDRIAQIILAPVTQARLVEAATLTKTNRGASGFGSTGVASAKAKKSMTVAPASKSAKSGSKKTSSRNPKGAPQR